VRPFVFLKNLARSFFRKNLEPVRLAGCWWLVLICSERKVLLAGC
jgi:hypothetical protein